MTLFKVIIFLFRTSEIMFKNVENVMLLPWCRTRSKQCCFHESHAPGGYN